MASFLFAGLAGSQTIPKQFPNQKTDVWVARDFRFHTGEVMPSLNIGYTTLGNPAGEPVINSADDERNPPELGVMERALKAIPNARLLLIPSSDQTSGHGTTGQAKWWKEALRTLLTTAPRR